MPEMTEHLKNTWNTIIQDKNHHIIVNEVDGKQLVKIVAWYDNEMSYSSQMVRTAKYLMK